MVTSIATGLTALCFVLVFWVAVQQAWGRAFGRTASDDPDVLAGRMGCQGLCEPDECARRRRLRARATEEEE